MLAWIAGIHGSVGADLRVRPPSGDHIGSPLRNIHVTRDSSTPCWNDTVEELY